MAQYMRISNNAAFIRTRHRLRIERTALASPPAAANALHLSLVTLVHCILCTKGGVRFPRHHHDDDEEVGDRGTRVGVVKKVWECVNPGSGERLGVVRLGVAKAPPAGDGASWRVEQAAGAIVATSG